MSENAVTVVEISVREPDSAVRANEIREWLLRRGIVEPNRHRDDLWQPSEFAPGHAAAMATPGYESDWDGIPMANGGVDVITKRRVHHPIENYEPPACPACGASIDEDEHHSYIEAWIEGVEPHVQCTNCGTATRLGDWRGEWTFQVGELAVRFNNWPPIDEAFLVEIGERLGVRSRVVFEHS